MNNKKMLFRKLYDKAKEEYENADKELERLYSIYGNDKSMHAKYHELHELMREVSKKKEMYKIRSQENFFASEICYSDVKPYEVLEQKTERLIVIREMDTELTIESSKELKASFVPCGFFGRVDNNLQKWNFKSNPKNPRIMVRLHKDGLFYSLYGQKFALSSEPVMHRDFNF